MRFKTTIGRLIMKAVFIFVAFLFIIQIFGSKIQPVVSASETLSSTSTPSLTSNILVNNFCNTSIKNQATAVSNTGKNSVLKNTGDSSVLTGNATLVSHLSNQACNNDIEINSLPNYFSDSEETRRFRVQVLNDNNAELENQATAVANTGKNNASENTKDSLILTGNAGHVSNLSNQVGISDIEIKFDSDFNIDSEETRQNIIKVSNSNNTRVTSLERVVSNTGDNQADHNSGFTRILTGHSSLEFLSDNLLNTTHFNLSFP